MYTKQHTKISALKHKWHFTEHLVGITYITTFCKLKKYNEHQISEPAIPLTIQVDRVQPHSSWYCRVTPRAVRKPAHHQYDCTLSTLLPTVRMPRSSLPRLSHSDITHWRSSTLLLLARGVTLKKFRVRLL